MKRLFFLLLFLILTSYGLAEGCVVALDGYCDENCLEVDGDCLYDPDNYGQDIFCVIEADGICDPQCKTSDIDCFIQQHEPSPITQTVEITEKTSQTFISRFDDATLSITQIWLLGGGMLLVMIAILLFLYRAREKLNETKYKSLIPYGQSALEKGYSQDQIRKSLASQGYDETFINEYMKTLEHRP